MAEVDFERRLERMFSQSPELPDGRSFADRVERRLNRGWTARRWLIGAAGVFGGVLGASQLLMSNIFQRVETAETSAKEITSRLTEVAPAGEWLPVLTGGSGVVWMAAGVAVLMMGFVLTRVIEEI